MVWYVVNTLPNKEKQACLNLKNQDFEVFFPTFKKTRRRARRIDSPYSPLFPGYLFVSLDVNQQRWSPINGTFGVKRLLMANGRPSPTPDGFVETLQESLKEGGQGLAPDLELGQKVKLLTGPFADQVATLTQLSSSERVTVLLQVLGGEQTVKIPRRAVTGVLS